MFADIILPINIGTTFTYGVPVHLQNQIAVGIRVEVPFGTKKKYAGIVVKIHQQAPENYIVKPILNCIDDQPILHTQHLDFWQWIANYYMCNVGEVMNAVLPAFLKLTSETSITKNEFVNSSLLSLSDEEYLIMEALEVKGEITLEEAQSIVSKANIRKTITSLIEKQCILTFENVKESYRPKTENIITLNADLDNETSLQQLFNELEKAPKQLHILLTFVHLQHAGSVKQTELLDKAHATTTALKALINKKILFEQKQKIDRILFKASKEYQNFTLSTAQQKCFTQIQNAFSQQKPTLFFGVTGSGKTNVHIKLIEKIIAQGKQVLYLLPEIALTAQLINKLYSYFGDCIGVYHSKYNNNERLETWQNIVNQKYKIIIGARSALFLPFAQLGLIIVDEEHDTSYKQNDTNPRYQARDAAIMLAHFVHCPIVLSTATPSIESYTHALQNKYNLVSLTERYAGLALPKIEIINNGTLPNQTRLSPILSNQLIEQIKETIQQKKQVILFQNRRGFAPYLYCSNCAWNAHCRNCDVSLTYHKATDKLHCHYCGTKWPIYKICPSCTGTKLYYKNYGTERIEDEVKKIFPTLKIDRLDTDTARTKSRYQAIITAIEKNNTDILIGTQLVVKGLDFDNVQLVGVLSTDSFFTHPNFRVNERAFQILSQVSGRAGRKDKQGTVYLQTINTKNPYLQLIQQHNYAAFYEIEIAYRKQFLYPPFTRLIKIIIKHKNQQKAIAASETLAIQLHHIAHTQLIGPSDPVIARIMNTYQREILIKCVNNNTILNNIKTEIRTAITQFTSSKNNSTVQVVVDVDTL